MYDFKTYIEYFKILGRFLPINGKHSAMAKFGYIFAFIVGVIVFNSCTQQPEFTSHQSENFIIRQPELKKAYGAYLAGRVAHLRKNFNVAADYYMEALNEDPENKELLGRVYVILSLPKAAFPRLPNTPKSRSKKATKTTLPILSWPSTK